MRRDLLFQIPSTWCWIPLGEIAEVKLGKMLSRKAFEPDLIQLQYLRNQNVRWGRIDYSDIKTMGFKKSELERYSLKPGDLLVCEGGEPGRCAIYTCGPGEFMYQKALHRIRPFDDLVLPKFLQFCLWNYIANGLVLPRPSETTIQHLPREGMLEIPIPLPPLPEQKRIVAEIEKQFTRIEAATAGLRRAQANLKAYRAAVLKAACEGRLVPNEAHLARMEGRGFEAAECLIGPHGKRTFAEVLPDLPEGWCWARAEQLSEFITKGTTPAANKLHRNKGDVPYLKVHHLGFDGTLHFRENPIFVDQEVHTTELRRSIVRPGDVLMNIVGPPLGKVAVVPETYSEWNINQAIARYRPLPGISHRFFCRMLQSEQILNWGIQRAKATAGQFNLTLEICRDLPIPVAPTPEQERIADELERRFSVIDKLELLLDSSLKRSELLRSSVLRSAFAGKLLLSDPSAEPATELLERIRACKQQGAIRPQRGRGIKPGVSTPGSEPQHPPKPRRGAGNTVRESAAAPSGLPDDSGDASLGLKPQALRPGPFRAVPDGDGGVARERSTRPGKTEDGQDFLGCSREEQIDHVWESLLGLGAVEKDEAIRTIATDLREKGLAQFQRLRQGGALYEAISSSIDRGIRAGSLDRPRRGHVRALLPDAREYSPEEWRQCLLGSLNNHAIDEEDALRAAADWARENMGLEFSRLREDGVILRGLREALNDAVNRGEIQRKHGKIRVLES